MTAAADPSMLMLTPEGSATALQKRFATELALAVDDYRLRPEVVPAGFAKMPEEARALDVQRRLEGRASAAVLFESAGSEATATLFVFDGRRTLWRTTHGQSSALGDIVLGVRELLATAYNWEVEEPAPVEETVVATEAAPPPPVIPPGPHAVVALGGVLRDGDVTAATFGAGAQHAMPSRFEARELVEGVIAKADGASRVGVNARVDVGFRFGEGVVRVVPMAVGRLGWLGTRIDGRSYSAVLARLGVSPELRVRVVPSVELVVRPEVAWNIAPLRVERASSGASVVDDGSVLWGGQVGVAWYL